MLLICFQEIQLTLLNVGTNKNERFKKNSWKFKQCQTLKQSAEMESKQKEKCHNVNARFEVLTKPTNFL